MPYTPETQIRELERQRLEMLRIIGALVEQLGGEVTLAPADLAPTREIERERIGNTIRVVARRA